MHRRLSWRRPDRARTWGVFTCSRGGRGVLILVLFFKSMSCDGDEEHGYVQPSAARVKFKPGAAAGHCRVAGTSIVYIVLTYYEHTLRIERTSSTVPQRHTRSPVPVRPRQGQRKVRHGARPLRCLVLAPPALEVFKLDRTLVRLEPQLAAHLVDAHLLRSRAQAQRSRRRQQARAHSLLFLGPKYLYL